MNKKGITIALLFGLAVLILPMAVKAAEKTTYVVKEGDCLWTIAEDLLGNGAEYTKIYKANRDKIENPRVILPGQELTVEGALSEKQNRKTDILKIGNPDYQTAQIYAGYDYELVAEKGYEKYIITSDPDVAEIKDGHLITKKRGVAVIWLLNVENTGMSLIITDEDAKAVWENDTQYVLWDLPFSEKQKKIKSVKSSDETVAKGVIEGDDVLAKGVAPGACTFTVEYENGTKRKVLVNTMEAFEKAYEKGRPEYDAYRAEQLKK